MATRSSFYGEVLLSRPRSYAWWTAAVVFGCVLAVLFFATFTYHRKAHVSGVLLPANGISRIVAPQFGSIDAIDVAEGARVQQGQALFVIGARHERLTGGDTQATVSALLEKRSQSLAEERERVDSEKHLHAARIGQRIAMLDDDRRRLQDEIALQQHRIVLAEAASARVEALAAQHFVSLAQVQERDAETLDQRQKLSQLQGALLADTRDINEEQANLVDVDLSAARDEAKLQRDLDELAQERAQAEAERTRVITAPLSGTVSGILVSAGASVTPGQPLVSIMASDDVLEAELYVPSQAAGFVAPGDSAWLRFAAFPAEEFGQAHAHVREVSQAAIRSDDLGVAAGAGTIAGVAQPYYRVRARLPAQSLEAHGQRYPLRAGMLLEANLELDERHLYELVVGPVRRVAGRL